MTLLNLGVDTSMFKPILPELRSQNIEKLCKKLEPLSRGKSDEQSKILRKKLKPDLQIKELREIMSLTNDYPVKHPDVDVESKLKKIDWDHDKIIVFVGRLIANKGIQSVIAAYH